MFLPPDGIMMNFKMKQPVNAGFYAILNKTAKETYKLLQEDMLNNFCLALKRLCDLEIQKREERN